ncbi:hypothetical protein Agabi119p4_7243 [Agaricus bisporus var. burnettii]|uniref:RecF/RecN/SMC N-terminal domain-containing protein n=1 Tax=Agaricus bisporus var. burnettii TaxID=192524 RepID=A0A8H7C7T7_AGABI|nr:hypothetical protein Agabi119p4_7243 [Agaricus bisporus var. burnettii]
MPGRKRTAVEDADDSASDSPMTSTKRQRTEHSDLENGRPQKSTKAKGKAKAADDGSDDDEVDDEVELDIEIEGGTKEDREEKDKQFEEKYYEKIMASVKARENNRGLAADFGIIEKVELYQFMCHQRLTFTFGPQINFIVGHNGSGKSAVASAITIALGGKTNSTGRGSGLKSFIREGQTAAEVSLYLKNRGDEAFRHKEYGDTIIINRRFTAEGSSTWKIKSKDGRVISTKREELSKICDHMNIQIDNPLTVLTQDASRVFLASSNPSDRYTLFMKGTQLQQLSDEYSITLENVRSTSKILEQKKEAIPDLRAAAQEAKRRFDEAENARKQKAKQDDLKKEMAWAHVQNKQDELQQKELQANLDEATENFTEHEEALAALGNINDLEKRKQEIGQAIKANKATITRLNADRKAMNTNLESVRRTIVELDQQIQRETEKLAQNAQAKRARLQEELTRIQNQIAACEQNIAGIQAKRQELESLKQGIEGQGKELEGKQKETGNQIAYFEQMITNCDRAEKDSLLPYGRNIKGVVDQISKMRWHGNIPLGPLGSFVKAKDPQTWGDILRNQLGQQLMAFAITDARDRPALKQLLAQTQNNHVQIVISSTELFDYSEGEPPAEYLTVLRALEINNPFVTRILINNANIESRVLAKTRLEAQRMLERLPRGGAAWTHDQFNVRVFTDGVSSIPLDIRRNNDSSNLMLTGRDSGNEKRRAIQEIATLRQQQSELGPRIAALRDQYRAYSCQTADLMRAEESETAVIRQAQAERQKLERGLNEEMPVNVNSLIDAKKESEEEIVSILKQFEPVVQELKTVDEEQKKLLIEANEIKLRINAFEEKRSGIQHILERIAETRLKAQGALKHYEKRYQAEKEKVEQERELADVLQKEFASWTEKAAEYCARVENPRPLPEIEIALKSVTEALKRREKRQGASIEEVEEQLIKAKQQYYTARSGIKSMQALIKKLRDSLITRYSRWECFRQHIALRTKVVFQYHLSQRGYFGKLLFDHSSDNPQLALKVQTDDQASQVGHKEKDPKSLSGGEKSFSTICLLLALWETIACPIRCLDEFDVFMDAVNRRISMKMMIDTANASNQKQYILITPLEIPIEFGNTVRVHKMTDPQRNQGTLGFGR